MHNRTSCKKRAFCFAASVLMTVFFILPVFGAVFPEAVPAEVERKEALPVIQKTVARFDSSGHLSKEAEAVDAGSRDALRFYLYGTVPEIYDDAEYCYYSFYDTYGKAFREISDVKVQIIDKEKKQVKEITSYAAIENDTRKGVLQVSFPDLKKVRKTWRKGERILVTYAAKLSEHAVSGAAGNPNRVHIRYNMDPEQKNPSKTKETEVKVYTWDLELRKVSAGDKKALADAEFHIQDGAGWFLNTDGSKSHTAIADSVWNTDGEGKLLLTKIGSGQYRFTEIRAPKGHACLLPFDVKIIAGVSKLEDLNVRVETDAGGNAGALIRLEKTDVRPGRIRIKASDPALGQALLVVPPANVTKETTTTGMAAAKAGGKGNPKTGDDSHTASYIWLLSASGFCAGGAAFAWTLKGLHQRTKE